MLIAGRALAYQDRAVAYTEAPTTLQGLWRQRRRWLTGNLAAILKHGWGRGAPLRVRILALPNLWFAHIGTYLLALLVAGWAALSPTSRTLPVLQVLGTIAITLDLIGVLWAYAADRGDPRDLLWLPLQRMGFPWFAWTVFASVFTGPPRAWAKITRRDGHRLLG